MANVLALSKGLFAVLTSLALAGCMAEPESLDVLDEPEADAQGVFPNHLGTGTIAHNGLTANPAANSALISLPLGTATFADATAPAALRYQLRHGGTREMMKYLVGCALDAGQTVSYTDTSTATSHTFQGEVGLCPSWNNAGITGNTACQELVSACLLARVNAFGKSVQLSMRGQTPTNPGNPLFPKATVPAALVTENAATIPSFAPCGSPTSGAARNCGWTGNLVGTCTPGTTVGIGAGSKPQSKCSDPSYPNLGSSTGNTVLRVCDGLRGCDNGGVGFIKDDGGSCGTPYPAFFFQCPASGEFSVMSGPQTSGGSGVASPAVGANGSGVYPATEQAIFEWEEGAYYGNLFGENALNPLITGAMNRYDVATGTFNPSPALLFSSDGAVYRRAYACSGRYWASGTGYMMKRVCAGNGDEDCPAESVGACGPAYYTTSPALCPSETYVCSQADGPSYTGDGDVHQCDGASSVWQHAITVYLDAPNALVGGQETIGSPGSPPVGNLCP